MVQNWSKEPYVLGAYAEQLTRGNIEKLARPLDGKVYFAGEALPPDRRNWGYAHYAALSGAQAANEILGML